MTPSRPYLLRAIHEWLSDNGLTPQLLIDSEAGGVEVPVGYAREGRMVLNVSAGAVRSLVLGNQCVEFDARFGGSPFHVVVPVAAVHAITARENGAGMSFPGEEGIGEGPPAGPDSPPPGGRRPRLEVVK